MLLYAHPSNHELNMIWFSYTAHSLSLIFVHKHVQPNPSRNLHVGVKFPQLPSPEPTKLQSEPYHYISSFHPSGPDGRWAAEAALCPIVHSTTPLVANLSPRVPIIIRQTDRPPLSFSRNPQKNYWSVLKITINLVFHYPTKKKKKINTNFFFFTGSHCFLTKFTWLCYITQLLLFTFLTAIISLRNRGTEEPRSLV